MRSRLLMVNQVCKREREGSSRAKWGLGYFPTLGVGCLDFECCALDSASSPPPPPPPPPPPHLLASSSSSSPPRLLASPPSLLLSPSESPVNTLGCLVCRKSDRLHTPEKAYGGGQGSFMVFGLPGFDRASRQNMGRWLRGCCVIFENFRIALTFLYMAQVPKPLSFHSMQCLCIVAQIQNPRPRSSLRDRTSHIWWPSTRTHRTCS